MQTTAAGGCFGPLLLLVVSLAGKVLDSSLKGEGNYKPRTCFNLCQSIIRFPGPNELCKATSESEAYDRADDSEDA